LVEPWTVTSWLVHRADT